MTIESITSRAQMRLTLKTLATTNAANGVKSTSSVPENDSIAITNVAQNIKQAVAASTTGTIVDTNKVTNIKNALANGSYQINAETIAKKMIQYDSLMS